MANSDNVAQAPIPTRDRSTQRVTFSTFLRESIPNTPETQSPSSSLDHERTPLLRESDSDIEQGNTSYDSDEDPFDDSTTKLSCTKTGTAATILVLLAITGICVAAVYLGVSKHTIKPGPGHWNPLPPPESPQGPRNEAYLLKGTHGAVASEDKTCSNIGLDVLKDGGNAVDAAIAANLCIGTVNMFASGIGGGGFAIVRLPPTSSKSTSSAFSIDFRETAPALANETMYGTDPALSKWGGLAVGVPGELRGLAEMHKRWGRLSWKRIVSPSAKVAMGWSVTKELAARLPRLGQFILNDPDWKPIFAPNGVFLKEGEHISRLSYGETLHRIAEHGAEVFYKGPIADSYIAKVQAKGGILTQADVESYTPHIYPALEGSYRGRKVYTTQAPTSGPVVLNMLNVLEGYDLVGEGRTVRNVHRLVEAMKFGFAARTRIADPAFLNQSSLDDIAIIPTKEYAHAIRANITDDRTHGPAYYNPVYDVMEDHGTTHTSVVDSDGMAVGITSTVNLPFGSRVLDVQTGVIMNDEMDDFATWRTPDGFGLYPSPYNYPQPGKRPLSSIAPTVLEMPSGALHMIAGGSGGSRIFGSIVQVILNVDWGLDISQAVELPRVHDQLFPQVVTVESYCDMNEMEKLKKEKGHNIMVMDINLGVAEVQAVLVAENGTYFAASDSRKNGVAAAY